MTRLNQIAMLSALGLAVSLPGGASAQDIVGGGKQVARVAYSDLDLGSQSGVHALNGRIAAAARQLCSPLSGEPFSSYLETRACIRNAVIKATDQVRLALGERERNVQSAANEARPDK
jgi:UrcA family protein